MSVGAFATSASAILPARTAGTQPSSLPPPQSPPNIQGSESFELTPQWQMDRINIATHPSNAHPAPYHPRTYRRSRTSLVLQRLRTRRLCTRSHTTAASRAQLQASRALRAGSQRLRLLDRFAWAGERRGRRQLHFGFDIDLLLRSRENRVT